MARCTVLVSFLAAVVFLTAVAYARRIAHHSSEYERHTDAHASAFVPGQPWQPVLPGRRVGVSDASRPAVAERPYSVRSRFPGTSMSTPAHQHIPRLPPMEETSADELNKLTISDLDDVVELPSGDLEDAQSQLSNLIRDIDASERLEAARQLPQLPQSKTGGQLVATPRSVIHVPTTSERHEDAVQSYLKSLRSMSDHLLTSGEELVLGRRIQELVRWQSMLDILEGPVTDLPKVLAPKGLLPLGRKATLDEWANACGFENLLQFAYAVRAGREAKQKFIASNLRLVVSIAKRWRTSGGSLTFLDLIQEGTLGLVRAIEKFDPEMGFKFSTYATPCIKSAIWDGIQNKGNMIRVPIAMQAQLRELNRVISEISATTGGRFPTDAELMERMHISKKKLASLLEQRYRGPAISTEDRPDWLPLVDTDPLPSEASEADFMKLEVEAWLETLPARDSDMLRWRFGLGGSPELTYQEIAERLGISATRARDLILQILWKMTRDTRHQRLQEYID